MLGLSATCVTALTLICLLIGDGGASCVGLARSWDVSRRRCPKTARFGAGNGTAAEVGLSRADGTASEGRNCERRLAAPVQPADGGGASHNGLAYFLEQPISKNPTLWVTRLLGLSNVCVLAFIGVLIWCCWQSRVGAVDGGARSSSQVFAAWHGIAGGDVRVYRNAVLTGEPGVSCSEDGRALIYPRHVGQAGRHGERACERARRAWRRSGGLAAGGEGEGRMESNVHHMRVCSGLEFFREAARWRSIAGSEPAPVPAGRIC